MLTTILPSGSALCLESNNNKTTTNIISKSTGLGLLSYIIHGKSDEYLKIKLFSLLQPVEICSLSSCSKALYVLTTLDVDVWRDLALNISEQQWKQCVEHNLIQLYGKRISSSVFHWKSTLSGTPIKTSHLNFGVWFSDALFTSTRCAQLTIPPEWIVSGNNTKVDRITTITAVEFQQQYEIPRKPVILSALQEFQPGIDRWKRGLTSGIMSLCSNQNTSSLLPIPRWRVGPRDMNIHAFACYCIALKDGTGEESPLYVFDSHFVEKLSSLGMDYMVPDVFTNTVSHPYRDLFELLGPQRRPDYRWIILGAPKTGSKWHIDPNKTHAWNACLFGTKKWLMLPAGSDPPPGVSPSPDGGSVIQPVSLIEWFLEFYQITKDARPDLVEFIQEPGDVVFVPSGTWHAVLNVTESCAVTQNYVSETNAFLAYQFFKYKPDQISGLRDDNECEDNGSIVQEAGMAASSKCGSNRKSTFSTEFFNVLPQQVKQQIEELEKIRIERHSGVGRWIDVKEGVHNNKNAISGTAGQPQHDGLFCFNFFQKDYQQQE